MPEGVPTPPEEGTSIYPTLDAVAAQITARLLPGGPAIDLDKIVDYISAEIDPSEPSLLSAEEHSAIREQINRFRDWNRAYCEARAILSVETPDASQNPSGPST